jgi:SAM-dependent methyltransferase
MSIEARNYFKYLNLVREDIREEFDSLGISPRFSRIGDFGCGNGITTFGLAIETQASKCIGIDLFSKEVKITPKKIEQLIQTLSIECKERSKYDQELCELIKTDRVPKFQQGNIVTNINLPQEMDLAYCKKVLVNLFFKEYEGIQSGEQGLINGLRNIFESLCSGGRLCVIEYYNDFILEKYLEKSGFLIERREQIEHREVRSKGRTKTLSPITLYLCRKKI